MNEREKILKVAKDQKVKWFIHFTNAKNIPSIIENGLLSVAELKGQGIKHYNNDDKRMDDIPESISLSVSWPNYQMFYSVRQKDSSNKWVVLRLKAEEVLGLNCAFCYTNAASNSVRSIPLETRKTVDSFTQMFSEREDKKTRKEMGLKSFEPTDPQAEILVCEKIPASMIESVHFDDEEVKKGYRTMLRESGIYAWSSQKEFMNYFTPRHDYIFWGKS